MIFKRNLSFFHKKGITQVVNIIELSFFVLISWNWSKMLFSVLEILATSSNEEKLNSCFLVELCPYFTG